MKPYFILALLMMTAADVSAQSLKWAKKARKAQVSVVAHTADGQIRETQGVFIDREGTLITEYDFLKGAGNVSVIDSEGREFNVCEVAGASAMYNIAKLKTDVGKEKIAFLTLAATAPAEMTEIYILPNAKANKSAICTSDTIRKVETFKESYNYYTLAKPINERLANAAVMNRDGELVALVQLPAKEGSNAYAIDANYATSLCVTALDAGNDDLKAIGIRKSLPDGEEEALTYIYLLGQKDTTQYRMYVDKFIERFPGNTSGYVMKAEMQVGAADYNAAKATYEQAMAIEGTKKDEIHFSMSKMIFAVNTAADYKTFEDWTLERALQEAGNAYEANPLPIYTDQEANCLYALKRYDDAADKFLSLTKTNLRSPDIFMYAVQCKRAAGAPLEETIALMDSALSCYPKPYPVAAANTIIMRAKALAEAGKSKEAVIGYNDFEHLSGGNLSANFFYEREQLEVKCRMYPAALNDIEKAIKLSPSEPLFHAEAAALNYRVGETDEAIRYAREAIARDESFADAYRILGVCLNHKGEKAEALKNLQKAVELGDTMAQGIMDKIKQESE